MIAKRNARVTLNKRTKRSVHYREFKDPAKNCSECYYRYENQYCMLVDGHVGFLHVCDLFARE
jgi:hypothetical protein